MGERRAKSAARWLHFRHPDSETRSPASRSSPSRPMKPATDYIRHAAKLARKLQMDAAMGGRPGARRRVLQGAVQSARRDRGRSRAGLAVRVSATRPADRVAGGAGGAVRAPPGRAPARRGYRGRELSPLHRPGLSAADQLAGRDGDGGSPGRGKPGTAGRGAGRSRRWRSCSTTRTTICGCSTASTASGRRSCLRHPHRGSAPERAGRRAGGAAGEIPGRAARQAVPARRLVGPAALAPMLEYAAADTRHLALLRDILRGRLEAPRPAGVGQGGVRPAGRHSLESTRRRARLAPAQGRQSVKATGVGHPARAVRVAGRRGPAERPRHVPHPQQRAYGDPGQTSAGGHGLTQDGPGHRRRAGRAPRQGHPGGGQARSGDPRCGPAEGRARRRGGCTMPPSKRDWSDSRRPGTGSPSSSTWRLECSAPTARSRPSPRTNATTVAALSALPELRQWQLREIGEQLLVAAREPASVSGSGTG